MKLSLRFSITRPGTHAIARAIVCGLMLMVLPSCGIPPLRHPAPGPGLPADSKDAAGTENSGRLGIEEFYSDRLLTCLIEKALADNRELKNLNEDVAIAANEVLARSGAYLPFVSVGTNAGLNRYSAFTLEGAGLRDDPFKPRTFFPNPMGSFGAGINFTWQLDIYRQLRNARDSAGQRYVAAAERRNFFVTRLVAEIAENYYRLMALDKRIENLNQIIELQERSLRIARLRLVFARGNQLGVLRFQAEVQRNQSQKLIVNQDIILTENRINYLVNRYPQPVQRATDGFFDLKIHPLALGVPSQLLQNRPDIREAERQMVAAGLDVKVARVNFFPQLVLNSGVGLEAFSLRYLFEPSAVIGNIAGGLVGPLVNRRSIRAQYLTANARQLQSIYDYQRIILNAFTEVINRVTQAENYGRSVEIKMQQLKTLEAAVDVANNLFQNARTEYVDVLLAQNALFDARVALIDTKVDQLTAVINTYQALGGGVFTISAPADFRGQFPYNHTVRSGEDFRTISLLYYRSPRYCKALWAVNRNTVPDFDRLPVGAKIAIPRPDQLDPALFEEVPGTAPPGPGAAPANQPATHPAPPPPPAGETGPFDQKGAKDPAAKENDDTNPPAAPPMPAASGGE